MFLKQSYIKRKIRGLAWKVFNIVENNGNCNFEQNGEKIFIENLFKYLKNRSGDNIVFDIGANIGEYSSMITEYSLKNSIDIELHLFEPTKSCFSKISQKFNNQDNIKLNNFGISNNNCSATIFYDKKESGLASLYQRNLDSYNLELNQSENIQLKRVDEYIIKNKINHIDFAKIDIEGHELQAFEGFGSYLNSDFIDYIQFEYGGANLDSHSSLADIYKLFENKGFKIAKIMPKGLEIRKYSPFMDNFQYSNYIAISNSIIGD